MAFTRTNGKFGKLAVSAILSSILLVGVNAAAQSDYDGKPAPALASDKPKGMEGVGITEKLGGQLDLNLEVTNENGEKKKLGDYFTKGHPVVLSHVYYTCPGLCNFHLNGLYESLRKVDWVPGDKFELLALSFDPKDDTAAAAKKRTDYINLLGKPGAEKGIHFLTAAPEVIKELTQETGFDYKWVEESKEWAHASAAIMISPEGKITRYLQGIIFEPQDIKLALQEAASGKIGTIVDKMVWYCFMYDPKQSKYTLAAFRLVQLGGAVMILVLAALLIPQWLRSKKKPRV